MYRLTGMINTMAAWTRSTGLRATLTFVVLFATAFIQVAGKTFFVSTGGSDGNAGTTAASAWKTLDKVNQMKIMPGDSLLLRGSDTFVGYLYLDSEDGNDPSRPIVISSYGVGRATIDAGVGVGVFAYNTQGVHIKNLILRGAGMTVNTKHGIEFYLDLSGDVRCSGVQIDSIDVHGFGRVGIRIGSWKGGTGYDDLSITNCNVHDNLWDGIQVYGEQIGSIYPHRRLRIARCTVYNNPGFPDKTSIRGSGIVISNVDSAVVEYCTAYSNGRNNVHCGGPGGIWAYDANRVVIQYSESYNNSTASGCDGLGFDLDGGVTNSVIQFCYSHGNAGGGYLLGQYPNARPWRNNHCRYNISVNDGRTNASAITLFKGSSDCIMDGAYIYNNSVYVVPSPANSDLAALQITEWHTGITDVLVANNIFATLGGVPVVRVPKGYDASFVGNLYWSDSGNLSFSYHGTQLTSLEEFRSGMGKETLNGTPTGVVADPMLTLLGYGDAIHPLQVTKLAAYRATEQSAGIDRGVDLRVAYGITVATSDLWGVPVPSGGRFDIGASEFSRPTSVSPNRDCSEHIKVTIDQDRLQIVDPEMRPGLTLSIYDLLGQTVVSASCSPGYHSMILPRQVSGVVLLRLYQSNGIALYSSMHMLNQHR